MRGRDDVGLSGRGATTHHPVLRHGAARGAGDARGHGRDVAEHARHGLQRKGREATAKDEHPPAASSEVQPAALLLPHTHTWTNSTAAEKVWRERWPPCGAEAPPAVATAAGSGAQSRYHLESRSGPTAGTLASSCTGRGEGEAWDWRTRLQLSALPSPPHLQLCAQEAGDELAAQRRRELEPAATGGRSAGQHAETASRRCCRSLHERGRRDARPEVVHARRKRRLKLAEQRSLEEGADVAQQQQRLVRSCTEGAGNGVVG